jgi:hypothetical protein
VKQIKKQEQQKNTPAHPMSGYRIPKYVCHIQHSNQTPSARSSKIIVSMETLKITISLSEL